MNTYRIVWLENNQIKSLYLQAIDEEVLKDKFFKNKEANMLSISEVIVV